MIEYICKYTPVEILKGFGVEPMSWNCSVDNLDQADKIIHRNICAFSRALIEHRVREPENVLILTNCCDSIRRVRDVLASQGQTVFILDLPHRDDQCSRRLYKKELLRFIGEFSAYSGRKFDLTCFKAACGKLPLPISVPTVALLGARINDRLLDRIQKLSPLPVINLTCTGNRRIGIAPQTDDIEKLMDWYASELLSQIPCMRMTEIASRQELINDPNICGIIYNTISFCDYYGFEYKMLREKFSLPMLKIETDYTGQGDAQLENRMSAFFENLGTSSKSGAYSHLKNENYSKKFYIAGIDSGSTSTEAVILDSEHNIVSSAVVPTGVSVPDSAKKAFKVALQKVSLSEERIVRTVSTGYGRTAVTFGNRDITEITCHGKGAYFLNPAIRTVIDMGGQDSKIIRLNSDGSVKDFAMNDKCAAGTGRFLEMMAQSLGITLEEISLCGLKWDEEITISSMCSVFAQSEVVSLIASGKKLSDIVHGLNVSVASKVIALGGRTGAEPGYMMTGGVAKNIGVVRAIEEKLGVTIYVPKEPEICGALGAALIAMEDIMNES